MSRVVADLVCRSLLCFGMAAAVGGLLRDSSLASTCATVEEPRAIFGAYDDMGDLVETEVVPLVPGQEFGWRLRVDDTGLHRWREVLVTPASPREWVGSDLTIEDGGRTGITERTEIAVDGLLEHGWTVTDGDPAGPHEIQLYLDDELVKVFKFVVR
jgi:hypothetical protein